MGGFEKMCGASRAGWGRPAEWERPLDDPERGADTLLGSQIGIPKSKVEVTPATVKGFHGPMSPDGLQTDCDCPWT
ncbi:hypothetical protein NicSoilC5_26680 [Arthrobacter sp. NicSoilC5]|nr:hypothetical protein NicSoilC5_26680 [Arthrobacter sp. NicSoilC5]